jgi:hypothetical protein
VAQEANGHEPRHVRRSPKPLVLLLDRGQPRRDGTALVRRMAGAAQRQWHLRHAYALFTSRSETAVFGPACLLTAQQIADAHTPFESVHVFVIVSKATSHLPAAAARTDGCVTPDQCPFGTVYARNCQHAFATGIGRGRKHTSRHHPMKTGWVSARQRENRRDS